MTFFLTTQKWGGLNLFCIIVYRTNTQYKDCIEIPKERENTVKKSEKLLAVTVSSLTAFQGVASTLTPIMAAESETETAVQDTKTSQQEELENSVNEAKKNVEEKTTETQTAKEQADASGQVVDQAQTAYNEQLQVVQNQYNAIDSTISEELNEAINDATALKTKIDDLNNQLSKQEKDVQQAEQDLKTAEENLTTKKSELQSLQDELSNMSSKEDLESTLNNATSEEATAKTNAESSQAALEAAQTALNTATADLATKQANYDSALSAYNSAQAQVNTAKATLDSAQATADTYNDPNGIAQTKTDLSNEQAALANAQAALTAAEATLTTAQSELTTAQNNVANAQTALNNSNAAVSQAQSDLTTAQGNASTAQSSYDSAKAAKEANDATISNLQSKITAKEKEVAEAQSAYDEAKKEYDAKLSPYEQAQADLAAFEKQYETQLARIEKGSIGYFESLGVDVSGYFSTESDGTTTGDNEAKLAGYTNIGAEGDATSLENLQKTIAYIKECNELRAGEGLSELSVSMELMAIAELSANWATVNVSHPSIYTGYENLAWGYGDANGSRSPFRGWYDKEKKLYESGVRDNTIGHYVNLINSDIKVTGFALSQGGDWGQQFAQRFNDEVSSGDVVMTVSAFESSLNSYCEELNSLQSQYAALKQAVEDNVNNTTKDDTALKAAEATLKAKESELADLKS